MRAILILLLAFSVPALSGCIGFYRTKIDTSEYVLYSDQPASEVSDTSRYVGKVISAYRDLFPDRGQAVPRPVIVYDEDELVEQHIYTTEIKQEGYYLPILNLIHLSPQLPPRDNREGRTVILHEMTHHFLISAFPETSSVYWVNEGLACALENSFFDHDGQLQTPLHHAWLLREARRSLDLLGDERLIASMQNLIGCSWLEFHATGNKTRHYALSWAFTSLLLERCEGDLEDKVEWIVSLEDKELRRIAKELPEWLRTDPQARLESLTNTRELRAWAIEHWLELEFVDGVRILNQILPLLEESDVETRALGYGALTQVVTRTITNIQPPYAQELREHLFTRLAPQYADDALSICKALQRRGHCPHFVEPLVKLLDSPYPELRVEAAQALSRLSIKPTITRPHFWSDGPREARAQEIAEWHSWLRTVGSR